MSPKLRKSEYSTTRQHVVGSLCAQKAQFIRSPELQSRIFHIGRALGASLP